MIEAKNITVEIHSKKLLDDVSMEMRGGEILAVLGPNGAGKSTLRKILCGDLLPSGGEVLMNEKTLADWTLTARARARAVLPQDSSLNFPFTVSEIVLMGRAPHVTGAETEKDYEIARAALAAVEESELAERLYPTLSGGERQRVQLARVLAQIWENSGNPRYLLLDEPTSNLDPAHQHQTLQIARRFAREGVAVLIILHDLNLAAQYADKILLLKNGRINAFGTARAVFQTEIIRQVFAIDAAVIAHPHLNCPLIVYRG